MGWYSSILCIEINYYSQKTRRQSDPCHEHVRNLLFLYPVESSQYFYTLLFWMFERNSINHVLLKLYAELYCQVAKCALASTKVIEMHISRRPFVALLI